MPRCDTIARSPGERKTRGRVAYSTCRPRLKQRSAGEEFRDRDLWKLHAVPYTAAAYRPRHPPSGKVSSTGRSALRTLVMSIRHASRWPAQTTGRRDEPGSAQRRRQSGRRGGDRLERHRLCHGWCWLGIPGAMVTDGLAEFRRHGWPSSIRRRRRVVFANSIPATGTGRVEHITRATTGRTSACRFVRGLEKVVSPTRMCGEAKSLGRSSVLIWDLSIGSQGLPGKSQES